MCRKLIILCVTLVVVGLSMPALAGKITYVDCYDSTGQTGNTTMLDGSPWTATTVNSGTDGLWRRRVASNFGNPNPLGEGDVYEANGAWDENTENVHALKTTITIPTGPEFQGCGREFVRVYALIWGDPFQWRIRAWAKLPYCPQQPRLDHMPLYYANTKDITMETEPLGPNNGQAILSAQDGSDFKGTVLVQSGSRSLYICDLGCAALGETVTIYVDSDNDIDRTKLAATWNARTWFDGVGYTPEPATIALLGLGGLALRRRSGQALLRRKRDN